MRIQCISFLLCLSLLACTETPEEKQDTYDSAMRTHAAVAEMKQNAPTPEEVAKADSILAYHNSAQNILAKGMLADKIYANASFYNATWQLPARRKGSRPSQLKPPAGLFDIKDAQAMTVALQGMDRALDNMLGHYASLEKYVLNPAIQDDGKKGKELVKKIMASHEQYMAARKSWLAIMDARAREAEKVLLYDHPLQRQIMIAHEIFMQFREVANLVASGGTDRAQLVACNENILRLQEDAAKPPFAAKPGIERLYKDFLHTVSGYSRILKRAITEGLHEPQRREINIAQEIARQRYNEFVSAMES